jgi:hypothetical protein
VKIDVNDPAVMSLALNNVSNVAQHYGESAKRCAGMPQPPKPWAGDLA